MDKKQLLIKVLTRLQPYRDMAEGILVLVESSYMDEKTLDGVIHLINISIKSVKKENQKKKIRSGLEKIQQIKALEDQEKMSDSDINKLLEGI